MGRLCYYSQDFGRHHLVTNDAMSSLDAPRETRNPFVETTLAYAFTYVGAKGPIQPSSLCMTILADTDYYSPASRVSDASGPRDSRFVDFGVPLDVTHKTGLGSSAALVTALVGAILYHYEDLASNPSQVEGFRERVHNLAQAAHCAAQGKIGSGFDVAAAVYGTCVYRRFSPTVLEQLGDLKSKGFQARLVPLVDSPRSSWDYEIQRLSPGMPLGLRLILCDVNGGSETRGMVRSVGAWQVENPAEAGVLWQKLQEATDEVISHWQCHPAHIEETCENLGRTLRLMRCLVRELSTTANVPIEPRSQTQLLDFCSQQPGIVGGVVPGAGGYDALAIVARDWEGVPENLAARFEELNTDASDEGYLNRTTVRVLEVKNENGGLQVEPSDVFGSWIN